MGVSYQIVLFAVIIGILPITWWLWVIIKENHIGKGSMNLLVEIFFFGVLTAVPASIIEMIITETGGGNQIIVRIQNLWLFGEVPFQFIGFLSAFLIATIEELSKLIGVLIALRKRKIKNPNDGLIFGIIVGLAFAVTENGVYFTSAVQLNKIAEFSSVVAFRFILSTSAHIIYSGLAGLFLVKAKFANGFQKIKFVGLAILFPILIHATFNFLIGSLRSINEAIMAIIMAVGLVYVMEQISREQRDKNRLHCKEKNAKS